MTVLDSAVHPLLDANGKGAPDSLAELLLRRADSSRLLTIVQARGELQQTRLCDLVAAAQRRLAEWQARGVSTGDAVILLCEDRLAFLEAFWAATLGGLIPVPVSGGISDEHRAKVLRIASRLNQPWLFTDAGTRDRLGALASDAAYADLSASFASLDQQLLEPGPAQAPASDAVLHTPVPDDIALIQFSSGSTSAPKGVVLTHRNLLVNLDAILQGMDMRHDDRMMSWMPLTHDMGLIGFHLTPVTADIDHLLMPTDVFVRRPGLWLQAASEHRATVLCSPNFGYEHYLKSFKPDKVADMDLSAVRLVFNGAEPISAPLIERFNTSMAPFGLSPTAMFPVYGLAEASLAVSFPPIGRAVVEHRFSRDQLGIGQAVVEIEDATRAATFVSVGSSIPHVDIRIADDSGQTLPDGHTGHLLIRGENVTAGYLIDTAENSRDTSCIDDDGWLDTGDLAVRYKGEIHVTGRAKDILFANGQNLYPHDLENTLTLGGIVDAGKVAVAAAPAGDGDQLCVFVLHRAGPAAFIALRDGVRRELAERTGVSVDRVIPVPRIPKTTSGKVQRFLLVESLLNGEFDAALAELPDDSPPGAVEGYAPDEEQVSGPDTVDTHTGSVASRLLSMCNARITDRELHPDDNLFELGISSLTLAEIHADIESAWPETLDITDLFDYPTVSEITAVLEQRNAQKSGSAAQLVDA